MNRAVGIASCLAVSGILILAMAGHVLPANAAKAKKSERPAASTVTAVSIVTSATITAPVRTGRWGQEVRLPGGTWIDCRQDCRETLRQNTVDFWEWMERRDHQNK